MATKAYKFRMEPTVDQQDALLRQAAARRLVWNLALDRCQSFYKEHKKGIPWKQLSKELTEYKRTRLWMSEYDAQAMQQALNDLRRAYVNHWNPKMRAGFPKMKRKKDTRQSFRIPQRVKVANGKVYVPKVGWVKITQSQEIEGTTKSATFKRTAAGRWFVTLVSEFEMVECKPKVTAERVTGGDLGLYTYLTLSDGSSVDVPKFYRKAAKKLRRAQRQLSRKVKGSRNREKARLAVALVHERIANLRSNFAHQLSHKLVSTYPALALENLSIKGLARTKQAKSMLDAAFGETLRQLKYKSLWNNTHFVQVDRFFPSTQLCSECGYQNKTLTLSDREWQCPACETSHNRDMNASLNIRDEGIRILVASGHVETLNGCGSDVRPAKVGSLRNLSPESRSSKGAREGSRILVL